MPIFRPKPKRTAARASAPDSQPRRGDIFTASVRDLASDGRGVLAHPSGLTVFVAGVWPGESGRFRLTGLQNRLGTADLLELEVTAPQRTQPLCPHHGFAAGDCGGCPWQFMDYRAQLAAKQARVEAALGQFRPEALRPIWSAPEPYGYRNRAQLKSDGERVGYLSASTHQLAGIGECPVLTPRNQRTLAGLLAMLPNPAWQPRGREPWSTLNVDESLDAAAVVLNGRLPFQQANDAQNQRMRQWLTERCAPGQASAAVLELFCGSGNFTRVLAAAGFARVVAVDASGPATEALAREAMPGLSVLTCDLFDPANYRQLCRGLPPYSTVVLDPPRDGMRHLAELLQLADRPRDVFYVSCNLATLQRDLAGVIALGYRLLEAQPLDQAPHTPHIELLCHLQHKRRSPQ